METSNLNGDRQSEVTLVVALGNPGDEYRLSRHNIAWQLIEYLSFFSELTWQKKFKGEYTSTTVLGERIWFLAPLTFMNLSGQSLVAMMKYYKIDINQLLVLHDELELEFGVVGFKKGGGLAGHNGLRSVAVHLGSRDFKRFRLGISRPSHNDITSYVLGNFSKDEQSVLPTYLEKAADLLQMSLEDNFSSLAEEFKKKKLI